jgi:hypothetical protein
MHRGSGFLFLKLELLAMACGKWERKERLIAGSGAGATEGLARRAAIALMLKELSETEVPTLKKFLAEACPGECKRKLMLGPFVEGEIEIDTRKLANGMFAASAQARVAAYRFCSKEERPDKEGFGQQPPVGKFDPKQPLPCETLQMAALYVEGAGTSWSYASAWAKAANAFAVNSTKAVRQIEAWRDVACPAACNKHFRHGPAGRWFNITTAWDKTTGYTTTMSVVLVALRLCTKYPALVKLIETMAKPHGETPGSPGPMTTPGTDPPGEDPDDEPSGGDKPMKSLAPSARGRSRRHRSQRRRGGRPTRRARR